MAFDEDYTRKETTTQRQYVEMEVFKHNILSNTTNATWTLRRTHSGRLASGDCLGPDQVWLEVHTHDVNGRIPDQTLDDVYTQNAA